MSVPSPAQSESVSPPPPGVAGTAGTSKVCWTLSLGHGHAAQYHNFKESCPPEVRERSVWVGMDFYQSGDFLASLSFMPAGLKRRRNEMWHFEQGLKGLSPDDVIFIASWNLPFI